MELETINKLYLELSQIATAKTKREIRLEAKLNDIEADALDYCDDASESNSLAKFANRILVIIHNN